MRSHPRRTTAEAATTETRALKVMSAKPARVPDRPSIAPGFLTTATPELATRRAANAKPFHRTMAEAATTAMHAPKAILATRAPVRDRPSTAPDSRTSATLELAMQRTANAKPFLRTTVDHVTTETRAPKVMSATRAPVPDRPSTAPDSRTNATPELATQRTANAKPFLRTTVDRVTTETRAPKVMSATRAPVPDRPSTAPDSRTNATPELATQRTANAKPFLRTMAEAATTAMHAPKAILATRAPVPDRSWTALGFLTTATLEHATRRTANAKPSRRTTADRVTTETLAPKVMPATRAPVPGQPSIAPGFPTSATPELATRRAASAKPSLRTTEDRVTTETLAPKVMSATRAPVPDRPSIAPGFLTTATPEPAMRQMANAKPSPRIVEEAVTTVTPAPKVMSATMAPAPAQLSIAPDSLTSATPEPATPQVASANLSHREKTKPAATTILATERTPA